MSPFILHPLPAGEVDTDAPITRHQIAGDREVEFLHVHFAGPGCFAFRVDRA